MADWAWTIRFEGYLPVDDRMEDRLKRVIDEIDRIPESAISVDEAERVIRVDYTQVRGWLEDSRRVIGIVRAGRRIVVRPPWEPYEPKKGEVVLEIDSSTSFGSGLHESTRLCLAALEERVRPGDAVIDLGTGSGVLAVCAAKLGASSVTAIDADSEAVEVATANVDRNGLAWVVGVRLGNSLPEGDRMADIITANIVAPTIAANAPAFARALKAGGTLIAAGMTLHNVDEAGEALIEAGLEVVDRPADGKWVALIAISR